MPIDALTRNSLKALLILQEGMRLKPYVDTVNKLTIGVGRNLEDVGITEDESTYLLSNDIDKAVQVADTYGWFNNINSVRKIVIISMLFNLGRNRFILFKNMIGCLEKEDFGGAADAMMSSFWASQVGKRAVVLSDMMRTGES